MKIGWKGHMENSNKNNENETPKKESGRQRLELLARRGGSRP